jgi:hypothetical protein
VKTSKLRVNSQTLRILASVDLARVAGASDDTTIHSGLTICITRIQTLCTVISAHCTIP